MSKILFDVHELENILKIWDTWACLPKKSECILFGFLSAQELENGRLAMFAFSGIVTQVAQWSEMWALQTWMRIYPQVSLFTKPLRTYSVLSYLDLFGNQNLLLMTQYEATCIVWRQGLGCNAVHFFAEALLKFQLAESVENSCSLLRRVTNIIVGQPLLGHHWCLVSLFLDETNAKNNPSHSP